MLVRTSRATRTAETLDDLAIPHESSLHLGLREERRQIKGDIDSQLRQWEDEELIDANTLNKLKRRSTRQRKRRETAKWKHQLLILGTITLTPYRKSIYLIVVVCLRILF